MDRRGASLRLVPFALILAALPAVAGAKKPKPYKIPGPVSISASPNPTVFGTPVSITGDVKAAKAGVVVTLQSRKSTGGPFTTLATAKTDKAGRYQLGNRPSVNVYYRVLAATTPATQSGELLVKVRMLVGLRVSDSTPAAGSRVRLSGIVRPPHNGRTASIQRLAGSRWVTVARTTLRRLDSKSSRYAKTLRVRRSGSYRVRVLGHADHAMGISRTRTLTVH